MVGIQMYTVRALTDTEENAYNTMVALREMGYEFVQLAGNIDTIELCANAAKRCGMPVCGILADLDLCETYTDRLLKLAKELGVTEIGISSFKKDTEGSLEIAKRAVAFARKIKEQGFIFSYHNHSHEFIRAEDGRTFMDIMTEGFGKDVWLMPDTYWLQHGGIDVRDFLVTNKGKINTLHLKDMKRTPDGVTFAEIGGGNINMKGIIETARDCGIKYFVYEQDKCDGNPLDSARASVNSLKGLIV